MRLFEFTNAEVFNTKETGKNKYDDYIANPEKYPDVTTEIKYVTPKEGMAAMAKGQGTSVKKIVDRRMKMGGAEKVDKIAKDLKAGEKYHIPTLVYDNGGFSQDGYHRLMAAEKLGLDKVPVLVIHR